MRFSRACCAAALLLYVATSAKLCDTLNVCLQPGSQICQESAACKTRSPCNVVIHVGGAASTASTCGNSQRVGELFDVACGKPTTYSSCYSAAYAGPMIVDGDMNSYFFSNYEDYNAWVMVDLETEVLVEKIRLLPRTEDFRYKRFNSLQILLGDQPAADNFTNYDIMATFDGPGPVSTVWVDFDVTPVRSARYVVVRKYKKSHYAKNEHLEVIDIFEMQVMTKCV